MVILVSNGYLITSHVYLVVNQDKMKIMLYGPGFANLETVLVDTDSNIGKQANKPTKLFCSLGLDMENF